MSESTGTSREKLDKIAATIRNLLARADDPRLESEHERAALYAKAEELQQKYRVAEEDLISGDSTASLPITKTFTITTDRSDFWYQHLTMWVTTANHTGCRFKHSWKRDDLQVTVVGYAADVQYAEALYQAAWLMMGAKLEPSVDPKLSDAENVYRLRGAGIERNRVAQIMWGSDLGKSGHAAHARVGKLYAEACLARGEDPVVSGRRINKKIFRETFGEQFAHRYAQRLREARDAAEATGGTMVLHGRQERVDEAFYVIFPEDHPDARRKREEEWKARLVEREADGKAPTKAVARRRSGWTKKDQQDWERRNNSEAALSGSAAGRSAADKVRIDRTFQKTDRVESGPSQQEQGGLELEA